MAGRIYPTTGSSSIPRSGAGRIYPGGVWKRPEEDEQEKKRQEQENQRRIRAEAINNIPQPKQGMWANFGAGLKDVLKPAAQAVQEQVGQVNRFRDSADQDSLKLTNMMQRASKKPEFTSTAQVFEQSPAGQFLNKPKTQAVIQRIARETQDIPLRTANRIEAAVTSKSYAETTAETDRAKANPENGKLKNFLYNIQSAGPQTAIGALLAVGSTYLTKGRDKGIIGDTLASTFFASLSADEQIKENGKVTSPGKIVVDVVGDRVLTSSLTKVFATPAKSLTKEIIKDFGIEGGTEVAQSLAKYGIDYNNARSDEERAAVLERAKKYVKEEMVMEFAVGGVIGGGLGATTGFSGNSTNITVTEDDPEKFMPSVQEQLGVKEVVEAPKERGGVRAELGITEDIDVPAQPVQMSVREQLQMENTKVPEVSKGDLETYGVTGTARAGQVMFGEPSDIGSKLIDQMGATYDEVGILAQASRSIEARRDARKLIRLMSDRVEEGLVIQKLNELQQKLESKPGSPERVILDKAITAALPRSVIAKQTVAKPSKEKRVTFYDGDPVAFDNDPTLLEKESYKDFLVNELENAEAGYRLRIGKDGQGSTEETFGIGSTFPDWIPEKARLSSVIKPVLKHIQNGTRPKGSRQLELYEVMADKIEAYEKMVDETTAKVSKDGILDIDKIDTEIENVNKLISKAQAEEGASNDTRTAQTEVENSQKSKEKSSNSKAKEKLKSRVYERLQQEQPEVLTDEVTYDAMKLDKDAEEASRLVMEDKDRAYRIAMGMEESADVTSTAVSIALAEQARADGNIELYNKLTINRSLRQTRLGQELVAEKGSVSDNSLTRYVKQLLHIRLEALGSSWTADIKQKVPGQKKKSAVARAMDVIDAEVKEAKTKISRTKSMDIGEAQKLIDSLKC